MLFEAKDILINAKNKDLFNYPQFENDLRKKLYYEKKTEGKIKNKAVLQLVNNIQKILKKQLEFDTNYKINSVKIYPIIIIYHRQLDVPAVNKLVNQWFYEEVSKLELPSNIRNNIAPITIINIDTFIFFQDLFSDKKIKLDDLINEYVKFTKINPKKKYKTHEEWELSLMDAWRSFSDFLGLKLDGYPYKAPRAFLEIAGETFDSL